MWPHTTRRVNIPEKKQRPTEPKFIGVPEEPEYKQQLTRFKLAQSPAEGDLIILVQTCSIQHPPE